MHWWKYFSQRNIFLNDDKNPLFFLYNNVTSIVKMFLCHFSTIRSGTTRGSISNGTQFFTCFLSLSTHLWVFAFFENSVIVKVVFFLISFEYCSNFSFILPKFVIFARICYPRKNLWLQTDHFSPCHLASHSLLLAKVAISLNLSFL